MGRARRLGAGTRNAGLAIEYVRSRKVDDAPAPPNHPFRRLLPSGDPPAYLRAVTPS